MDFLEGKKQNQQQIQEPRPSRSPSPESVRAVTPVNDEPAHTVLRTPPPNRSGPPPSPPVPTHPIAPVAPEPSAPLPLMPCQFCGRTFVPQSLSKHVKICEKMTIKKRKTFDSSRQRREGTDLEQYLPKNFGLPENSPFLEKSPPNTAKPTPKAKPQSVRNAITKPMAELQKCPHCNRAFGVRAFERHVEWCADKAKILPVAPAHPPQHIADAKQRLNARTQYKAPPVRHRKSSQSRDKSSNSRSASVDSSRGVSPTPPPREYGDCKPGRIRASESVSSNDCPEDTSLHMPVIKTTRTSQSNLSGDANVKARQARLAKDLNSSREPQDPLPPHPRSVVQYSNTDPNLKNSRPKIKPKNKLILTKQQQLKKAEENANKYKEKNIMQEEMNSCGITNKKSNIPLLKKAIVSNHHPEKHDNSKIPNRKCQNKITNLNNNKNSEVDSKTQMACKKNNVFEVSNTRIKDSKQKVNKNREKINKNKFKTDAIVTTKSSTMSLDSLEDNASNAVFQSVGINTELLCVPCVIHENLEAKNIFIKNIVKNTKNSTSDVDEDISAPKIEILYKNSTMTNSSDAHIIEKYNTEGDFNEELSSSNDIFPKISIKSNNDVAKLTESSNENIITGESKLLEVKTSEDLVYSKNNQPVLNSDNEVCNLSVENIEESYEHDLSEVFDDSIENKSDNDNEYCCGSGETYTKFTENPADLEEFMNVTDQMMEDIDKECLHTEKTVETFHTPNTSSLEAITESTFNFIKAEDVSKSYFSQNLEELKSNLEDLIEGARCGVKNGLNKEQNVLSKGNTNDSNINKNINNMEHISVYELKFYDTEISEKRFPGVQITESSEFKLPSIKQNKSNNKKDYTKKSMQRLYKCNQKYKMLADESRARKNYQTFIINDSFTDDKSDTKSISSEAPPLKLPRIEHKRLDDNYDPFESAARQMKELMSSETNIPNKVKNSSKDSSRTLPILRPQKEKTPPIVRSDNTKMMKDTLNKTYQKTPPLQRMKSFGSTNNGNNIYTFGGRSSSFRLNRNDKKPSQKLNTTFTKSSKENIVSQDKLSLNRNTNINRSFSSYTATCYSTPKSKEKMPKINTSMYHSFQRSTTKEPVKLDKINRDNDSKKIVNLDSIFLDRPTETDNSSSVDSSYIDPRLINENDNLPINVNTILNNPDIISSMESLLTTENLPAKFESFSSNIHNNNNRLKLTKPIIDDLSSQYEKIMSSLEQNIALKTSVRDDESLCGDFDLEEFISSFDDEINKHELGKKRTSSSTTRVLTQSQLTQSNKWSEINTVSSSPEVRNGMNPVNKSMSLNFRNSNNVNENLFPSSMKRSTSLLDSIKKKSTQKTDSVKNHIKTDQLEQDIMQSLKDFDKFYEAERIEKCLAKKEFVRPNDTVKRDPQKTKKNDAICNGNNSMGAANGKASNDSAYSRLVSLNRISPSKLSICTKEPERLTSSLDHDPVGTDSGGSLKEDVRSISSDEFLAMERSAELDESSHQTGTPNYKEIGTHMLNEKHDSSRASSRRSPSWKPHGELSSSGSEGSLHHRNSAPAPRLSRFCHECGNKFPVETAKFCIECGVKRLVV